MDLQIIWGGAWNLGEDSQGLSGRGNTGQQAAKKWRKEGIQVAGLHTTERDSRFLINQNLKK